MRETLRYRAFISYSHSDEAFVRWLHRRIETWSIPRELIGRECSFGRVPSTLRPIFRDRDDFSGGSSLRVATAAALEDSEALIVVCSRSAAKSPHVDSEIRHFKQIGRATRVIPIILDGEPGDREHNCFPPALLVDPDPDYAGRTVPTEPIAADARDQGDGRQRATAKVVAGLLGLPFDEIIRRDEKNRQARIAGWSGTAAGAILFATALSSFALYNAYQVSLTIEKGVFAIGGMIQETSRSRLDPAERDAIIATQCDLMDSLAGERRDLTGPEERAICFHRRVLAADDTQRPATTTRVICDWRDGMLREIKQQSDGVKALQIRAAAYALQQAFARLVDNPETIGECDPKTAVDIDAHGDYLLDRITELVKLRPDLDDLRSTHEYVTWDVIARHEARKDWQGSERIMRDAADVRLLQANGALENDYVPQSLIDRAVYLRRLAWLKQSWLADTPEAVRLAEEAVTLWDRMATVQSSDVKRNADQVVIAHSVHCEALAADGQKTKALMICEAARAMANRYLTSSEGISNDMRKSLEAIRAEISAHISNLRQTGTP
ncbi:toll/interleukin-1 receptor domain-containing protein [Sinorhizobium sp. 8-89]|nr:toll/interleukin-1 receptor domain-containing protein [Sinorhizobium sp. 7-81]MDK1388857.1 toll/interleukin-1 receptor domain-containing protein [Sinorhizobium sp. 7-81]